jgi:HEAT repeat protein
LKAAQGKQDPLAELEACLKLMAQAPGDAELVAGLTALLKSSNKEVMSMAEDCLHDIGTHHNPAAYANLLEAIPENAWFTAMQIGKLGKAGAPAVAALCRFLEPRGKDNFIDPEIVATLGRIGPAAHEAVPALVKLTKDDQPPHLRWAAHMALSSIAPATIDPRSKFLEDTLSHSAEALKDTATAAGPRDLGPREEELCNAALIVARLNPARRAEMLNLYLSVSGLSLVTTEAQINAQGRWHWQVQALRDLGPLAPEAAPVLLLFLQKSKGALMLDAADALGAIGPAAAGAVPGLQRIAASAAGRAAPQVLAALVRIDPGQAPFVVDLMNKQIELGSVTFGPAPWLGPWAKDVAPALVRLAHKFEGCERGLREGKSAQQVVADAGLPSIPPDAKLPPQRELLLTFNFFRALTYSTLWQVDPDSARRALEG